MDLQPQELPKNLAEKIEHVWRARWNQHIDLSVSLLSELQLETGWLELLPEKLLQLPLSQRDDYLELLLLKESLLRVHKQRQKSSAFLRKTQLYAEQIQKQNHFRLLFELGIDAWVQQDTVSALEKFMQAQKQSRNPIEQIFSMSNVLWCLEALDFERDHVDHKLEELILKLSHRKEIHHVVQQWQAYQIRKKFYREGKILKTNQKYHSKLSGQALYFKNWAQSLPYMHSMRKSNATFIPMNEPYLWQGNYRQRTLNYLWIPSEKTSVSIPDAIDRLYLWIWQWMAGLNAVSFEKINFTAESIFADFELEDLSLENALLLRNALEWLVVLDPSSLHKIEKLLKSIRKIKSDHYRILEEEFQLIHAISPLSSLTKQRHVNTEMQFQFPFFQKLYQQVSLQQKKEFLLPRLCEILTPYWQEDLVENDFDLIVNCLNGQIVHKKSNTHIRSIGMMRIFSELSQQAYVDISKFKNVFDSERSVDNLTARIRKLTHPQSIFIRGNQIFKGARWPKIKFLHLHTEQLPNDAGSIIEPNLFQSGVVHSEAHLKAAQALLPKKFDRDQLQNHLKISKSTACRMLESWKKKGLLRAGGKARATVYEWI